MAAYIESLQNLADQFMKLNGVGRKSSQRMAFSVLDMSGEEAAAFAQAILDAKAKIHLCPVCQNLTDRELCPVCADETRDRSVICVVADCRTVLAIEKVREYQGTYHVLHGVLSPLNGVTPDMLKIPELLRRVEEGGVREVIPRTPAEKISGQGHAAGVRYLGRNRHRVRGRSHSVSRPAGAAGRVANVFTILLSF